MGSLKLTIRAVLEIKCFQGATVIAGVDGLDRAVRWVHVMEVNETGKLLRGNELILSTGIGWGSGQKDSSLQYLKQLIDAGVSGLCVELVKFTNEVPKEMIETANEYGFPIIVFHHEVRFIDITQMINTQLWNNPYKILSDLEEFSEELGQTLLMPDAFKKVLYLLNNYLKIQILFLPKNNEEAIFVPKQNEKEQKRLLRIVDSYHLTREANGTKQFLSSDGSYAVQSIQTLGHQYVDLFIFPRDNKVNDFELIALDRCATAISQDLLRIFYTEEQKKYEEEQWIHDWLIGERDEEEIRQYLNTVDPFLRPKGVVVCVCRLNEKLKDSTFSYYLPFFRNIFQNHSLYVFSEMENKQVTLILLNLKEDNWKARVGKALSQIRQTDLFNKYAKDTPVFGVGKYTHSLESLSESFQTAKESLQIQRKVNMPQEYFYENLHIYRLVSMLNKHGDLHEYINEYIGSVVEYDQKHNSELLHTLTVLLESNGSKKDAAKRLYIVRQTLYHRLQKLKELLGEDYMEPTKRAAIEFSLYAYRYATSMNTTADTVTATR